MELVFHAVVLFLSAIFGIVGGLYALVLALLRGPGYFSPKASLPQSDEFKASLASLGQHVIREIKSRGIKLHYVTLGDQSKPLMIFIHGFPDNWYSWRHQMKYFASKYWVVAVTMRGYGESDKPSSKSAYRIVELAEDIKELILALGRSQAVLVSHDWGGAVAWRVAQMFPEVVDRLVAVNMPHPGAMMRVIRSSLRQCIASWYMVFFQVPYIPELMLKKNNMEIFDKIHSSSKSKGFTTDDDILYIKNIWIKSGLTSAINYYRANVFQSKASTLNIQKRVQTPTLILWGEKDPYLTVQTALESVRFVDSLKFKIYSDAGHWIFLEKPDEINSQIEDFLNDKK